jgi:hypothetical protein
LNSEVFDEKALCNLNIGNFYFKIEDSNLFDEDSKDNRSKAKEALLEWVRKKTTGYVV